MRAVIHLAVDADCAGARLRRESGDHRLGLGDLLGAGREHLVDHRHLRRMNGEPPAEAVAAREFGVATQDLRIPEVDVDGFYRRYLGRRCAEANREADGMLTEPY